MAPKTIGAILVGTLVQFFVMRVNKYVEVELIPGLDVFTLDGVNKPWLVTVPGLAQLTVDLERCIAGVVLMKIIATCLTIVSLKALNVACKTSFVKSNLYGFHVKI